MKIYWPEHITDIPNQKAFEKFVQAMAFRIIQGHFRYGAPQKRKLYLTRAIKELEVYEKTGNGEHLYNAANYCHLEMYKPQNPKFHLDNTVDSVTRGKV